MRTQQSHWWSLTVDAADPWWSLKRTYQRQQSRQRFLMGTEQSHRRSLKSTFQPHGRSLTVDAAVPSAVPQADVSVPRMVSPGDVAVSRAPPQKHKGLLGTVPQSDVAFSEDGTGGWLHHSTRKATLC
jgi:hypothetical protein